MEGYGKAQDDKAMDGALWTPYGSPMDPYGPPLALLWPPSGPPSMTVSEVVHRGPDGGPYWVQMGVHRGVDVGSGCL